MRLATSLFLVVLVLVLVHVEGEAVNCRLTVDVEPIAASPRQSAMEVERNADEGQTRSVVAKSYLPDLSEKHEGYLNHSSSLSSYCRV